MFRQDCSLSSLFKRQWLLLLALLFWLPCLLLLIGAVTYRMGIILYWIFLSYNYLFPLFEVSLLFCLGLCCIILWYRERRRQRSGELSYRFRLGSTVALIVLLAVSVNAIALRVFVNDFLSDRYYVHKASLLTDGSYYHLALYTGKYPGGALNLYQCDSSGQFCRLIQEDLCPVDPSLSLPGDFLVDVPIRMKADANQHLIVTIGGAQNCTYQSGAPGDSHVSYEGEPGALRAAPTNDQNGRITRKDSRAQ